MTNEPIQLPPAYVWRSYLGGAELRTFRNGRSTADDHFPEDWLASTVRARNGENQQSANEGLSKIIVDGVERLLLDVIALNPRWFWGNQVPPVDELGRTGILIKLLDSSVRLHLQAHPDRAFVAEHFRGNAGKTECWYILSVRDDDAFVYLGFQHAPTPEEWGQMVRDQDLEGMRACFEKIPVKPGDCLMVPAGIPHAIGEGIFMIELQEPTDWVVRCEFSAGGHVLPHDARFMGLELEEVLPLFDYTEYALNTVCEKLLQAPEVLRTSDSFVEERIIDPKHAAFFRLRRMYGTGPADWIGNEPMVLIALKGAGRLNGVAVSAGETWLLPGAVPEWNWTAVSKDWNILLAQPPIR
ncbi:class I mannose-6-phosphate isomerase [Pontiellaceae bacterium B12219]|nr:class I mannose-6-phosphate isomerase [Pontiellaceae bacterium B12219]